MNDRQYSGDIERLRSPERVARLEVARVVDAALEGVTVSSVLDIGTGSGLFAEAFAARGLKVAGVDLREDMLEAARQYVPQGEFHQAHMETLPFDNAQFDVVFMGLVLHEADDVARALQEARRVAALRVVVLEFPYEQGEFGPPLEHRLKPESVVQLGRQAGYSKVDYSRLTHMLLYTLDKINLSPWCI
ncbi:MAG TPA: class I SAM-dependent methyltransferase [Aggregatilineales bacterium]|jgi:ubiquinone/menaquinone biosynthesis C-methylase UbiE|nr:class I SAM-dependent methyltransferase [Aggregatilineales bacterium]